MRERLAQARTREAAERWVARQEKGVPVPDQVRMGAHSFRTFRIEAFVAGAEMATEECGRVVAHGELTYTDNPGHPIYDTACRYKPEPIPAEIAEDGTLVPTHPEVRVIDFPGVTTRAQAERMADWRRNGPWGSNVRPVERGPLADPDVVEGLLAASGQVDATCPLSLAKATAFRLQTPDPRFDPSRPVCVNGFLYHPATEA